MVKQVTHKELAELIKVYYESKTALFIYGRFGIGKSQVLLEQGRLIALEKKREFIEWNKVSMDKKLEIIENSIRYFVFIDIRLSENDPSDIKGIPDLSDGSTVWKSPLFCRLLSDESADGILFFDEINLAPPLVISSVYKIIYDRVINDNKISNDWATFGAGNTDADKAHVHKLVPPVRDRGGEVELLGASTEEWLDWAIKNNIDTRIIAYISYSKDKLYVVDFDKEQKYTTYRGWERLSYLIKNIQRDYNKLLLVSSSAIGEIIAVEFAAFCKIQEKVNISEILKTPEKFKEVKDIDAKYFITIALAEKFKDKVIDMSKIIKISNVLDEMENTDFIALLWRMCIRYDADRFIAEFQNKSTDALTNKFSKYIIR